MRASDDFTFRVNGLCAFANVPPDNTCSAATTLLSVTADPFVGLSDSVSDDSHTP
jgi:hypothetical protein